MQTIFAKFRDFAALLQRCQHFFFSYFAFMTSMRTVPFYIYGSYFIFQVTGAIILAIGIWTNVAPGSYDAFLGNKGYKTSANVMLAAGSVVMVVGFLGCCGAARESRCMLGWVR